MFDGEGCSASPPPRLAETIFSTTRLISLLLSFPRLGGYLTVRSLAMLITALNHFKIILSGHFQMSDIAKRQLNLQRKKTFTDKWFNPVPFQTPITNCVSSHMYLKMLSFLRQVLSVFQPFHSRLQILCCF